MADKIPQGPWLGPSRSIAARSYSAIVLHDGGGEVTVSAKPCLHPGDTELEKWRRDGWNPGLFSVEEVNVNLHALGGRSLRLLAIGKESTKEQSMKLHDWEQTIQQIIEESNREPKESGKSRQLMEWRAKLAREPHLLEPFQIDEIVREVRKRLTSASLPPNSGSPSSPFLSPTMSSPYSITR